MKNNMKQFLALVGFVIASITTGCGQSHTVWLDDLDLTAMTQGNGVATVSYTHLDVYKRQSVHYVATEGVYRFNQQGKIIYDVIFRVSDRDVAFKYKMYPQKNTLSCIVKEEATSFVLPDGSTTFLCPQSKPMGGFARTSPSYETPYKADDAMGKNGWGEGYTFPCLFRNGCLLYTSRCV